METFLVQVLIKKKNRICAVDLFNFYANRVAFSIHEARITDILVTGCNSVLQWNSIWS
jgi:hypothetical protein